jgi:phage tail sheath gpL-like
MRKAEIIKSDLKRVREKVVELEAELKAAEEFEQQQAADKTTSYVDRFNAERNKDVVNPFD